MKLFYIQYLAPACQKAWLLRDAGPKVLTLFDTPLRVLRLLYPTAGRQPGTFCRPYCSEVSAARTHLKEVLNLSKNSGMVLTLWTISCKTGLSFFSQKAWVKDCLSTAPRGNTFWRTLGLALGLISSCIFIRAASCPPLPPLFSVGHYVSLRTFSKSPRPGLLLARDLGFLPAQHMLHC